MSRFFSDCTSAYNACHSSKSFNVSFDGKPAKNFSSPWVTFRDKEMPAISAKDLLKTKVIINHYQRSALFSHGGLPASDRHRVYSDSTEKMRNRFLEKKSGRLPCRSGKIDLTTSLEDHNFFMNHLTAGCNFQHISSGT